MVANNWVSSSGFRRRYPWMARYRQERACLWDALKAGMYHLRRLCFRALRPSSGLFLASSMIFFLISTIVGVFLARTLLCCCEWLSSDAFFCLLVLALRGAIGLFALFALFSGGATYTLARFIIFTSSTEIFSLLSIRIFLRSVLLYSLANHTVIAGRWLRWPEMTHHCKTKSFSQVTALAPRVLFFSAS